MRYYCMSEDTEQNRDFFEIKACCLDNAINQALDLKGLDLQHVAESPEELTDMIICYDGDY